MGKKIALCIGGYWKSFTDPSACGYKGLEHLKEVLFDKHDNVDVFIHSWQTDMEQEIRELYAPWIKNAVFEEQINFSDILRERGLSDEVYLNDPNYNRFYPWNNVAGGKMPTKFPNYLSQAHTRSESLRLKKRYELKNNIKYDWVIQTRFDVYSINRALTDHSKPDVSFLKFSESYDNSKVFFPFWNDFNEGMPDIWFYSNSENMDKFIGFDEKIMSWYSNNTEYLSLAVNGWFDSDVHDCFSNEILKDPELKSKNLNSYNVKQSVNYAMFMKYLLKSENLYGKIKILEKISF